MNEQGRVLAWITPAEPYGAPEKPWGRPDPPESPAERAAHAALMAVADFYIAIQQAKTVGEALKLQRLIEEVELSVGSAERAARERADKLCDGNVAKERS